MFPERDLPVVAGQPSVLRLTHLHPVTPAGQVCRRAEPKGRHSQTLPPASNAQCKQESLLALVRLVRVSALSNFLLIGSVG